jgi:hypothetical protein
MKQSPKTQPNDDLDRRRTLHVPFTPAPKRKLRIIKGTPKAIEVAAGEGELLARILEHKDVTPEIANSIRGITVGACLYVAKELDTHELAPELVRDIYPWGKLAFPGIGDLFLSLLVDVKHDMPRMYKTIFPND